MATIVIYVWVQASSAPIVFLSKEHALCVMAGEYLMTIGLIAINRFIGVFIAIIVEILRLPVLPVAIGIYLPVQLNACIMVGGIIRFFMDKIKNEKRRDTAVNKGILFSSGMIAGEGLVGIALAVLAVFGLDQMLDISGILNLPPAVSNIGSLVVFALLVLCVCKFSIWKKRTKTFFTI